MWLGEEIAEGARQRRNFLASDPGCSVPMRASARKELLGLSSCLVGVIDRILIDEELFERERHDARGRERG